MSKQVQILPSAQSGSESDEFNDRDEDDDEFNTQKEEKLGSPLLNKKKASDLIVEDIEDTGSCGQRDEEEC